MACGTPDDTGDTALDDPDTTDPDTTEVDTDGPAPMDCTVSAWSAWSECSEECDGGSRQRDRTITQAAENGGACPDLTEAETCNTQDCTTPNTVRIVEYDGGAFSKITSDVWMHNTTTERVAMDQFDTDATTVFLYDGVSQNYYLNLDAQSIRTSGGASTSTSFFANMDSAQGAVINGFSATRAPYATGDFVMLESGGWTEHNTSGSYTFDELRRDLWSVYLQRTGGGALVRIDYYTSEILVTRNGQSETLLYPLLDPNTYTPGAWSVRQVEHSQGSFTHTDGLSWVEDAPDGAHFFTETQRDADAIWLTDSSRDVVVELAIADGEINVGGAGGNNRFLYSIDSTW